MLYLAQVLQLVVNRLDDRPFAKQYLVRQAHNVTLHVLLEPGNQLNPIGKQHLPQHLRNVSLVAEHLPEKILTQHFDMLWIAVVDIAPGQIERQQLTPFVAHQMQLEAVKPPHRAFAPLGQPSENLV